MQEKYNEHVSHATEHDMRRWKIYEEDKVRMYGYFAEPHTDYSWNNVYFQVSGNQDNVSSGISIKHVSTSYLEGVVYDNFLIG